MNKFSFFCFVLLLSTHKMNAQQDMYQWLEEVDGQKALAFVEEQNKISFEKLSRLKDYQAIYDKSLAIYNSTDRIAMPTLRGKYVYNFWKDKDHVRGIWRRCLLSEYTQGKYNWEILLDLDELSQKDKAKWVFKGAEGLFPQYNRFLVSLSNGGGDAVVIKEFDVEKKQFVENGFQIEEAKGSASYLDENTLVVQTNFGPGTMTTSGYARQVKIWKRGALLKDAQLVFEGQNTDVAVSGGLLRDGDKKYLFLSRGITFYTRQYNILLNNKLLTLDVPQDCNVLGILKNQLVVQLKSDWKPRSTTFASGSLVSLDFAELLKGNKVVQTIFRPDPFSSVSESYAITQNHLLVNVLSDVTSTLYNFSFQAGKWIRQKVAAPSLGSLFLVTDDLLTDQYFFAFQNFIVPSSLYVADAGKNTVQLVKSLPAYFDASQYQVQQFKTASKDGTKVPYFLIASKNMVLDSKNPTLVYAYGGFEVSTEPFYLSSTGAAWLERGGVMVVANIRGGGEYGPQWHQAGLKEKRQNVFDDLYAVSENLITKKITSPRHLGVMGGSNGGLLVGVAFTQRPDLYNAVVCQVPLLDMQRYNKLLAGASWMGEYGNPDVPEEWAYIQKYSPYHNLQAGKNYPEVFFTTSTRDDRVHPGHARKMVAKMKDMGYTTYYYENTEGGHAGSSTNEQRAKETALTFSYLLMKLKP